MKILYASRSHIEMEDAVRGVYFRFLLDRYVLSHSFPAAVVPTYAQMKEVSSGRGRERAAGEGEEENFCPTSHAMQSRG